MRYIFILALSLLFIGCATEQSHEASDFADDFEGIPIGTGADKVIRAFGRPSLNQDMPFAKDKVERKVMAYQKREFECVIAFENGKSINKPQCTVSQSKREQADDDSRSSNASFLSGVGNAFSNAGQSMQSKQTNCYSSKDYLGNVITKCN